MLNKALLKNYKKAGNGYEGKNKAGVLTIDDALDDFGSFVQPALFDGAASPCFLKWSFPGNWTTNRLSIR